MNGYIALYKDKKIEVYAETSYAAQCKAAAELKAKKQHEVSVYLVEKAPAIGGHMAQLDKTFPTNDCSM